MADCDIEFKKKYDSNSQTYKGNSGKVCECNKTLRSDLQKYKNNTQKIGFTLTFDSSYHSENPDLLYQNLLNYVTEHFEKSIKYIITIEFTSSGILHFHGVIYDCYQRYVSKILKNWRKTYGFVKIEWKISPKWEEYIIKDVDRIGYPALNNL